MTMHSKRSSSKSYKMKRTSSKPYASNWLTKYRPSSRAILAPTVGLGRSLKTKLKTIFFANLTPSAAGVFTGYLYPGSCFDPSGDLAAMQPAVFDQLAALYARYLVTDATVRITAVGTAAQGYAGVNPVNYVMAAYPSTVTTAATTYQGAASQLYSKTCMFTTYEKGYLTFKMNTQKIIGARLPVIAEDCGALVGASPTAGQSIVLPLFVQSNSAAATNTFTLKVEIDQDVIFDQRIQAVDA